MISRPFQNKQHRTSRQRSTQHAQIPQIKDRFVFSIQSMEMRRVVIPPNLLNHDTIEDTEVGMTVFSCTVRHGESAVSVPGGTFHTGSEDEGIADTENRDGSQLPLASTFSNRLQPLTFFLPPTQAFSLQALWFSSQVSHGWTTRRPSRSSNGS